MKGGSDDQGPCDLQAQVFQSGASCITYDTKFGAMLGDMQFHAARAGRPVPLSVVIALSYPVSARLAVFSDGLGANLHHHQPFSG
jgi:hypothetical protein